MRPIVLKGEKVSLGVLLKEDMEKIWMWNNDREVVRTLADPSDVSTLEEWHRWYENLSLKKSSKRAFAILNEGNNLVGTVIVSRIDLRNGTAEIGYFLGREHWGKGYATEAVRLTLEYCFRYLNLRKVYAKTYENNTASIRVLEKNGFKLVGRLRKHAHTPDGYVDVLFYDLLREEWEK
ncbi:Ribosomal protein-serine acetyltransferase RimL homolog [Thermococcus camini]|uniref:Ribosomal protein-serine acetyltransferase RimL homolog n=2 Tax=Thermococcus camini TaxID=2016373 RepID=A0A7G2D8S1_9EURY|nr:GNAT family protein [Thermococcus camini]CAD5244764.1 Ribosomal protein-serine acetyltransferase RimL homolog [Thermococcus camini]